ncbi:MAG: UvrD-helicase domain-containing protein [Phycisphaerae bacterium]|nr:UvrD-helicase domain-containing protein [Phycisphaerae bacterium]
MEFRIADTFTESLAKLQGDEQKAVKTTAFDLQMDPSRPSMQFHRLDRAKDKSFWSVRVSGDIRLIVHRSDTSLLLCYVDHHDKAYQWAERRRIERHPRTGAMQIVEIREKVLEIEVPKYIEVEQAPPPKPLLLADVPEETLLSYGVPAEWLDDVKAANEDTLFDLAAHLPQEAAEALLELATGGEPALPAHATPDEDPFGHPDAQRRFRLVASNKELERALEYPWDKWAVFLHPAQRETVERNFGGPARVAGSAGTGKTIVALHRAAHLARNHPQARVLLTTFSIALARTLRRKLKRLISDEPSLEQRIAVRAIDEVGIETYESAFGKPTIPTPSMFRALLAAASESAEAHRFTMSFLESEWRDVVDAWQLRTWEEYRDVARLGRKTRLGQKQRELLWTIFDQVRSALSERGLITVPGVFTAATELVANSEASPADFIVVDEAQDISIPQLRFLAAVAGAKENGLFFAGDLGQRIFQIPFSWKSLGVDVRGRSQTLRINYRTSHQIRAQADRLLPAELSDVDGNVESRAATVSAFSGPEPTIRAFPTAEDEARAVAAWLTDRINDGIKPEEIGIFVRSEAELPRARAAVSAAALTAVLLDASTDVTPGSVSICPMHFAKGLEFRVVVVAACDDEIVPLQARIEAVTDDADLEEVYNTERHLLYVACTRARDNLLITGVDPASEFLDDLCSS